MRTGLLPLLSLALVGAASGADTPQSKGAILAEKFGALSSVEQASLSPDGTKVAIIAPLGAIQVLMIADLVNGGVPRPILKGDRLQGNLAWCGWANNTRLICNISGVRKDADGITGISRLQAVNSDGTQLAQLTKNTNSKSMGSIYFGGSIIDWDVPGKSGQVLMTQVYIPESPNGTNIHSDKEGYGVDLVDSVTLKRSPVESPRRDAFFYLTDGHGTVRVFGTQGSTSTGYLRDKAKYFYRKPGSREWLPLSTVSMDSQTSTGFDPYAVDFASNRVFGFDDNNGFKALYSIALDGSNQRNLVVGREGVDIDSLITIGRDNRVIGASYATERRTAEYFDPELKALAAALSKALPGHPSVDIIDASAGENKLLILASSDTNPGTLYLFDKTSKALEEVLPMRNELVGMQLAPMQSVTYTAADGTQVPAYLTLPLGSSGKGLPAIVMPHGGPSSRDEWGFDWLVQYFAARGYAVLQPNYRGSAGYGTAWYKQNGFKSWRTAIGDVNDAGRWLVQQGIAAPDKLGIVGWSYGGYAALQSQVLDPDLYKAVIAIAPVTDLERLRQNASQFVDFTLEDKFIGNGPHIREGSPAQNAERFKAPVLIFHGDYDQNVDVSQSQLMASRLRGKGKAVTYVEFPQQSHQLYDAAVRQQVLSDSDRFLRQAFGLPAD